ncbi:hypothetical protein Pcinc_036217 [Petrolisthes cinctipes]|uniref:Uncharacterized protein n=1 Tax=Petrolisthes cinctipes TaxID=88211 RepID=A0AAE1EPL8_PETCI|nr:hypothetical protein Pcinc_036217 [Petrolisthes cinctipes]
MSEEWRIASLSQTIEEEEEEDLVPPTPNQDQDDPSHDTTLLGVLADGHTPGRRKPPQTLSLGLGDDTDNEPLPFLSLEWEPHFPVTPAQENGHPLEDRLLLKGSLEEEDDRDLDLALDTCRGRGQPQPGCSAVWATKTTNEACILRGASSSDNGGGDGSTDTRTCTPSHHPSHSQGGSGGEAGGGGAGEEGGGGGGGAGGGSGGDGEGGGGGSDEEGDGDTRAEEEESSHEPSSDSSEGVPGAVTSQSQQQLLSVSQSSGGLAGDVDEIPSSQGDLFASQDAPKSSSGGDREGTLVAATNIPKTTQGDDEFITPSLERSV